MPFKQYFPKEINVSDTVVIRNTRATGGVYIPGYCTPDGKGGGLLAHGEDMTVLRDRLRGILGEGIVELDEDGKPINIIGQKALRQEQARLASRAAKSINAHK